MDSCSLNKRYLLSAILWMFHKRLNNIICRTTYTTSANDAQSGSLLDDMRKIRPSQRTCCFKTNTFNHNLNINQLQRWISPSEQFRQINYDKKLSHQRPEGVCFTNKVKLHVLHTWSFSDRKTSWRYKRWHEMEKVLLSLHSTWSCPSN